MHPVFSEINRVRIVQTDKGAFPEVRPSVWNRWVLALKILFAERETLLEENAALKAENERLSASAPTFTAAKNGAAVAEVVVSGKKAKAVAV